ncbi:redoxin domain-containing protein [Alistipes sp.]|uniref:redoxin domain-containing protein n=1 Tax=Alistipes sp. TaxID=1872444 RepID=UPI003AF193C5
MKKLFILAAAAALCSCGGNNYTIKGRVGNLDGTVYLLDQQEQVVDSAAVEKGAFRFQGNRTQPVVYILSDSRGDTQPTFMTMVVVEPGTIVVDDSENPGQPAVKGTPSNDANAAYAAASRKLVDEYRNESTTDERRKQIEQEFDNLATTTMEANRDNFFGVMMLKQLAYEYSGQQILDQLAQLPEAMQQTDEAAELRHYAESKMKTDIGQPYVNIEQNDAQGRPVSLESVIADPANKYTLIDFWASWCGPCMGEVPHLKQTYDKFHKKGFEIYGVSFDENREEWLAAIEQNGMNWIQVSDLTGFNNPAAKDYAVQGIPANFLIDAQGKIVASNLRGEALYEKIAELLGE